MPKRKPRPTSATARRSILALCLLALLSPPLHAQAPQDPFDPNVKRTLNSLRFNFIEEAPRQRLEAKINPLLNTSITGATLRQISDWGLEEKVFAFFLWPDGENAVGVIFDSELPKPMGSAPKYPRKRPAPTAPTTRIEVKGKLQNDKLAIKVDPVYPPLARMAHIDGTVKLDAVIGADGHVLWLHENSGHALLFQASLDAVSQWIYRPTLVNGEPVEVSTQIEVTFTLPRR